MPLNSEDTRMLRGECDASPIRFHDYDPINHPYNNNHNTIHTDHNVEHQSALEDHRLQNANQEPILQRTDSEVERVSTRSSNSSSDSSVQYAGIRSRPSNLNHTNTNRSSATTGTNLSTASHHHPVHLQRIETIRDQHRETVASTRTKTNPLPDFGGGKPYPPDLPDKEDYVVEFTGHDDPLHAQNWSTKKKILISMIVIWDSLSATFGSSIFSPAASGVEAEYNIGSEVGTLGTSLFVLGYAFGPLMWAPFSELKGRRIPILVGAFGFGVFAIAVATAENIQTVLICRFFNGLFGSCPLAVVAAIFSDIYSNETRGLAIACFSATVFMGPLLAPFVGGFITISYLGWRWTEYISAIMGFSAFILCFFFLPETYPPIILVDKASELRRRTKNWGIHAKQEEIEVDVRELIIKNVGRPLRILFTEPIVLFITIYMSFIYGLLYLFLTAYALVFQGVYGFNAGVGGLPYFGLVIGELIAFFVVVYMNKDYVKKLKANNNVPVPEWRLPIVMVGAVLFTIGLFWFGWTGYQGTIPWIVPTLSGLFTGFGLFSIFLQLLNYIIDAYLMFAASAIAGNTFMRSIFGAVFPLFARYMYQGIGIQWGQTLIGCVALVLVPLPFIFYFMGKKIRAKSTFAPAPDLKQEKERAKDEEEAGSRSESNSGEEDMSREKTRDEDLRSA